MNRLTVLSAVLLILFLSYVFFSSKQIADIRREKVITIQKKVYSFIHDTIFVHDTSVIFKYDTIVRDITVPARIITQQQNGTPDSIKHNPATPTDKSKGYYFIFEGSTDTLSYIDIYNCERVIQMKFTIQINFMNFMKEINVSSLHAIFSQYVICKPVVEKHIYKPENIDWLSGKQEINSDSIFINYHNSAKYFQRPDPSIDFQVIFKGRIVGDLIQGEISWKQAYAEGLRNYQEGAAKTIIAKVTLQRKAY